MNGAEHYRVAEERLRASDWQRQHDDLECAMHEAAVAQVHATLAKTPIPDNVIRAFEAMTAAVMHGVRWDGTPESIGGVSKDEALDIVSDFITTFDEWRGGAA